MWCWITMISDSSTAFPWAQDTGSRGQSLERGADPGGRCTPCEVSGEGRIHQAWGKPGDPGEYRLIIDSLLNLPLLYRASELTGDPVYRECAQQHYKNVIGNIVRRLFNVPYLLF